MFSSRILLLSAVTAAFAGFLFGFDTVVISGAEQAVQSLWGLTDMEHGLAVSMALWGTVAGALVGGWPTNRYGRARTLISIGLLYFISAVWSALATDVYSFMVARFLGGVGVGISTVAAPLYISEIAPPAYRGRLAGMFQFNIVFGILVAYLSNSLLDGIGEQAWRWMLGVEAVPALLYTLFCLGIPESPRWLIARRGEREQAKQVLAQVNVDLSPQQIDLLADQIATAAESERRVAQLFFSSWLKVPILLTVLVAFFNQMSGINVVLYFAPRIFGLAGLEAQAARLESVGLGVTNLIFTMIGLWMIDHFGRKTLLLVGSVGYIASLGVCAWAFETGNYVAVAPALFAFIAAHAVGQGAVIWVFIAEIFPNQHRAKGQALGSFTHWVFAALLAFAFPPVAEQFNLEYVFGFFAAMMVLQLLWVLLLVPETKGVPLEEMQEKLGIT